MATRKKRLLRLLAAGEGPPSPAPRPPGPRGSGGGPA